MKGTGNSFTIQKIWRFPFCLEAAELLEVFQWSGMDVACSEKTDKIREELADVLNYCILMADACGLDMDEIIREKVKKNAKKYPARKAAGFFIGFVLDRAFNHAGTQAASADIFSHRSAIFNNSYSLHIRSPFPLGFSMGVRNVIPGNNTLFANLTIFSHLYTSL